MKACRPYAHNSPELLFSWLHVAGVEGPSHRQPHAARLVLLGQLLYRIAPGHAPGDGVISRAEVVCNGHAVLLTYFFRGLLAKFQCLQGEKSVLLSLDY